MGATPPLLVIEDEPDIRALVESFLAALGGYARIVGSWADVEATGVDGVERVLLDLQLPGINGIEICRRLKQVAPDIYVCAMTAQAGRDVDEALAAAGFDHILRKPFTLDEFAAAIAAG